MSITEQIKPKAKRTRKPACKLVTAASAVGHEISKPDDIPRRAPLPKTSKQSPVRLTPKQEKFCLEYMATGNAAEAYRRAYTGTKMGNPSIYVEAARLLAKANISLRVDQLHAERAARCEISIDTLSKKLDKAIEMAQATNQAGAYVQAVMAQAKLHGMITDKVETKATQFVIEAPAVADTTDEWLTAVGA